MNTRYFLAIIFFFEVTMAYADTLLVSETFPHVAIFQHDSFPMGILKAATGDRIPSDDFWGKTTLLKKAGEKDYIFLYLLFSPDNPPLSIQYKKGILPTCLKKPVPALRMPNSPLHTYLCIDKKKPGVLTIKTAKSGTMFSVNLDAYINQIEQLPYAWSLAEPGTRVRFSNFPRQLYGTIPQ